MTGRQSASCWLTCFGILSWCVFLDGELGSDFCISLRREYVIASVLSPTGICFADFLETPKAPQYVVAPREETKLRRWDSFLSVLSNRPPLQSDPFV